MPAKAPVERKAPVDHKKHTPTPSCPSAFRKLVNPNKPHAPHSRKYLTREEEIELVKAGQAGDDDARNKVIMNIFGLIHSHISKRRQLWADSDDAANHVVGVLCSKFHKFDLSRGVRYSTWASYWIQQSLQRFQSKNHLITIPFDLQFMNSAKDSGGRLERYGKYVENALCISTIEPTGKSNGRKSKSEADSRMNFQDRYLSREPAAEDVVSQREELVDADKFLDGLSKRERNIIIRRICKRETLKQVGDSLKITRERVRQIEYAAMQRLRCMAGTSDGEE